MARRVFITVGEASGDQHAALLIRELKALNKDIIVEGIGGPAMAEAGAMVHYDTVQRAAMGWKGALRYFEMRRIFNWSRNHFRQRPPDLVICIDSWAMNWHWAKLAHGMDVPVMYYIAPQMWASRPGRIKRLRRYVDRVACILPFEEKFFHPSIRQRDSRTVRRLSASFPAPAPPSRGKTSEISWRSATESSNRSPTPRSWSPRCLPRTAS
jgi:lipid-A-disaccharide synthase